MKDRAGIVFTRIFKLKGLNIVFKKIVHVFLLIVSIASWAKGSYTL